MRSGTSGIFTEYMKLVNKKRKKKEKKITEAPKQQA
jgi:hypothetical protein